MRTNYHMTSSSFGLRFAFLTLGFVILIQASLQVALADEGVNGVTAVSAKVSTDYIRATHPDGTYQTEYYAFGQGGEWAGQISDASLTRLNFEKVAHVIAAPLASRNYLPATDPKSTKLLIMVYWGMTYVSPSLGSSVADANLSAVQNSISSALSESNSLALTSSTNLGIGFRGLGSGSTTGLRDDQLSDISNALHVLNMVNHNRDITDFRNAMMLGYDSAGMIGTEFGHYVRGTAFGVDRADIEQEIEENRYFVVLMAYDFQLMWKEKKHKLLWETRFSISERRNEFDKALPVMARYASQYFGQASNGLLRTRVLEGRVDIGAVKSLGEVEDPKK